HTLADVLEQKVLLQDRGRPAELAAQPSAGRITPWLERHPPSVSTDDEGRQWLALRYQLVKTPEPRAPGTVPRVSLKLTSGATLDVPDWPVTVAPLTLSAPPNRGQLTPLQADRVIPAPSLAPTRRLIAVWLSATFGVLIAWCVWGFWRDRRESAR